jgi:hypothetical protein
MTRNDMGLEAKLVQIMKLFANPKGGDRATGVHDIWGLSGGAKRGAEMHRGVFKYIGRTIA